MSESNDQYLDFNDIYNVVHTVDLVMPDDAAPRLTARNPLLHFVVGCLLAWLLVAGVHLFYQTSLMVTSIVHSSQHKHERPQRQPYRSAWNS